MFQITTVLLNRKNKHIDIVQRLREFSYCNGQWKYTPQYPLVNIM